MNNNIENKIIYLKTTNINSIIILNKSCPYAITKNKKIFLIHFFGRIVDLFVGFIFNLIIKLFNSKEKKIKKSIIVFKQDRLGDLAVVIPLLAFLKKKLKNYKIILVASEANKLLAEKIPYVDTLIIVNNNNLCTSYREMSRLKARIISFYNFVKYDLKIYLTILKNYKFSEYGLDLVGRRRNALVMRFLGIKKSSGFEIFPFSFLYTHKLKYTENKNIIAQFLNFLKIFNIYDYSTYGLNIYLKKFVYTPKKKTIGIHIGYGNEKNRNYGVTNFSKLINLLLNENYKLKIFYTKNEIKEFELIMSKIYKKNKIRGILCKDLNTFLQELETIAIYVGVDSGPSHIVDILRIPNIILFSRENPIKWSSYLSKSLTIKGVNLNCLNRMCKKSICIRNIPPEFIFKNILKFYSSLKIN